MRSLPWITVLVLGSLTVGCRGGAGAVDPERRLPFIVRVNAVQFPQTGMDPKATTPAVFSDGEQLARDFAVRLDELGLFTLVTTADDVDVAPDLELDLSVSGADFGPGRSRVGGGIFSSIVWLFAGHASWWVRDRAYPDSDVVLVVTLDRPASSRRVAAVGKSPTLFEDVLPLKDLDLPYLERMGTKSSFANIVVPPSLIPGDPKSSGKSLMARSVEFFAAQEPEQILARLPARYFEAFRSFAAYDPAARALRVATDEAILHLRIASASTTGVSRRELDADALGRLEEATDAAREAARLSFSERAAGIAAERYYRIPLLAGESNLVRVWATLNNGKTAGPWTLLVPEA